MNSLQSPTSGYTLFRELADIALGIFSDVRSLREDHVSFDGTSPYNLSDDQLNELCDPSRWSVMRRIASAPRFPWDLCRIIPLLESGQRWALNNAHVRRLTRGNPQYETSHRLFLSLLLHARRMCLASPRYGELAFGLTVQEVRALLLAGDIALIEAAPQLRLTFRSAHFHDVLRVPQDHRATGGQAPILEHIVRASGLARARSSL